VFREFHHVALDEFGSRGALDWSRAIIDGVSVRAKKGISERSEPGGPGQLRFEDHVLAECAGLPLVVGVSAVNTNKAEELKPLVTALPAVRSCRGPRLRKPGTLHADKAYDHASPRRWVHDGGTGVRITSCS
jgi:hypothetical protein